MQEATALKGLLFPTKCLGCRVVKMHVIYTRFNCGLMNSAQKWSRKNMICLFWTEKEGRESVCLCR